MNLTSAQLQIVSSIDREVTQIIKSGKDDEAIDTAILEKFPVYAHSFKSLLNTLKEGEMDELVGKYHGLYRFAKLMERLAEGIRDGVIKVPEG